MVRRLGFLGDQWGIIFFLFGTSLIICPDIVGCIWWAGHFNRRAFLGLKLFDSPYKVALNYICAFAQVSWWVS